MILISLFKSLIPMVSRASIREKTFSWIRLENTMLFDWGNEVKVWESCTSYAIIRDIAVWVMRSLRLNHINQKYFRLKMAAIRFSCRFTTKSSRCYWALVTSWTTWSPISLPASSPWVSRLPSQTKPCIEQSPGFQKKCPKFSRS